MVFLASFSKFGRQSVKRIQIRSIEFFSPQTECSRRAPRALNFVLVLTRCWQRMQKFNKSIQRSLIRAGAEAYGTRRLLPTQHIQQFVRSMRYPARNLSVWQNDISTACPPDGASARRLGAVILEYSTLSFDIFSPPSRDTFPSPLPPFSSWPGSINFERYA